MGLAEDIAIIHSISGIEPLAIPLHLTIPHDPVNSIKNQQIKTSNTRHESVMSKRMCKIR